MLLHIQHGCCRFLRKGFLVQVQCLTFGSCWAREANEKAVVPSINTQFETIFEATVSCLTGVLTSIWTVLQSSLTCLMSVVLAIISCMTCGAFGVGTASAFPTKFQSKVSGLFGRNRKTPATEAAAPARASTTRASATTPASAPAMAHAPAPAHAHTPAPSPTPAPALAVAHVPAPAPAHPTSTTV